MVRKGFGPPACILVGCGPGSVVSCVGQHKSVHMDIAMSVIMEMLMDMGGYQHADEQ